MKSHLFRLFALLALIAMIVAPVSAQTPVPPVTDEVIDGKYSAVEPDEVISRDEPARYIVLFEGDSLVASQNKGNRLEVQSEASQNYLNVLAAERAEILANAEAALNRELNVRFVYDVVLNGVSVDLTPDEAVKLETLPNVRKVMRVTLEQPDTDAGPAWIGAPEIWDGSAVPNGIGADGEGIVAGILDTGINFDHPSFSDTPEDSFVYEWTGDYLGVCHPTTGDPDYVAACNEKLVGAYTFTTETLSPEDANGHGTHTASTVAGNYVTFDFMGVETTISGVAPHAQIIAYDVCDAGGCYSDGSAAAVQQAIINGVDVINYSISGGQSPYSDPVELAFLEAFDAGIFVAASAGNLKTGEPTTDGMVNHLSPWVMTVAASSHNRKFTNDIDVVSPAGSIYVDMAQIPGSGPIPFPALDDVELKWAGDDTSSSTDPYEDNRQGCNAFPDNFFDGDVALIRRGVCNFAIKVNNAAAAGAIGVLVYADNRPPISMGGLEATTIPAGFLYLSPVDAAAFADYVDLNAPVLIDMTATGRYINDDWGDIKADFSYRGPGANNFEVLKPEITAPGLEILAGVADGVIDDDGLVQAELYQGTSMSSPHTAGAGALIKALHPDWSAAEIKSAIMLTAKNTDLLKEDMDTPADAFDFGSGRVNLTLAGLTGLVMDETYDNFVAADPAAGGDPKELNVASLQNNACVGECSWTRTFTSVAGVPATYTVAAPAWITVAPASFTIAAGGTQEITITADVSALTPDEWQFATIEFNTDDSHAGGTPIVVLSENFSNETFPPTGWTFVDVDASTGGVWSRAVDQSLSAPASAKHDFDCTVEQDGWLITPLVSIPATGITTFNFHQRGDWTSDYVYHGIHVSTGSPVPADGDFVEIAEPAVPPEDAWTTTPISVDLTAYAGEDIYVAFQYTGDCADDWWVDDVQVLNQVTGDPISDVSIPAAILPTTGNLPEIVKFETHRDAGGGTLEELVAVEITDLTVDTFGFVKGNPVEISLVQDPTNGDAYDDLSQVYYTLIPMDAGAARVVAEITATTAQDLDLFWGFDANGDGMPSEDEQYEASATSTAFEYVSDWGFPVGFYDVWVLVQNWKSSTVGAEDDITLTLGVVPWEPVDPATMTVIGPETNAAGAPFSLDVLWHDIDTETGDRLYGLMDVYADAAYEVAIGTTEVDVVRGADDVVKTADVEAAVPGDVITYTIEIQNYSTEAIEYTLDDVLPEGVTYVPGSVTGGAVYDEVNNAITWTGNVDASYRDYVAATSAEDPNCSLGIMTDGDPTDAYLDLKTTSYAFSANASISGDDLWYTTFSSYPPFNYYGVDYTGMDFTDDGYAGFDMVAVSNVNQEVPNPTDPNNVMAMFWDDFTVVYDAATNKGVTIVGDNSTFAVIEYDDVSLNADPTKTMDMEIGYFLQPDDTVGAYEIIFAYDNITSGMFEVASGTIGVENVGGTAGTLFSYNDTALTIADGSAICFDWALLPAPPKVITFQVTVDDDTRGLVTNEVQHDADLLGAVVEIASWDVIVNEPIRNIYLPVILK